MKYEKFESDCYNLYTIKTDKFRNCHMEIVFRSKCSKEGLTSSALLFDVLMENNKTYPSRKLLERKKRELYNANIYSANSRVGASHLSNVVVEFLDPKYMEDGSIEEILNLTFDLIFNPNVSEEEFDAETYEIVSSRLMDEINSLKEDPKQSSILSALKNLDGNSCVSLNSSGDAKILEDLTPKKLYDFYKKTIEECAIDIYIIGNLDMKEVAKIIKKYAKFTSIKTDKNKIYLDETSYKNIKNVTEKNNQTQMNLVQIYNLKGLSDFETNYCLPIWNLLWGSGSLESKVYKLLRGANAMCYNVTTYYQKYDRLLILHTAIDGQNSSKALKLIKECFDSMKKGNIKDEELKSVKNMVISSLNLILDSPGKLIDNYLFKNIANLEDIESRIDNFNRVSIKDLINVSKKIKLVENYKIGE